MTEQVLVTAADRVGRVTLNRPRALNAITIQLAQELELAIRDVAPTCNVILLRGAGGNFCVGGDVHELDELGRRGPGATAALFDAFAAACDAIASVDVPVVAAVDGYAMAGGFELMQVADVAIVRSDAQIADQHANFGQVPGGGGSQRLPRLVGRQRASALVLTGDRLSGTQAAAWGLAYAAPEPDAFDAAVEGLVSQLASKDREAQSTIKRLLRDGLELPLRGGLALERIAVVEHQSRGAAAAARRSFEARGDGREAEV